MGKKNTPSNPQAAPLAFRSPRSPVVPVVPVVPVRPVPVPAVDGRVEIKTPKACQSPWLGHGNARTN